MKRLLPAPLLSTGAVRAVAGAEPVARAPATFCWRPSWPSRCRCSSAPLRPAPRARCADLRVAAAAARSRSARTWSCRAAGRARRACRAATRAPQHASSSSRSSCADPHGLAALAIITTVVPGTVWSELAPDRSALCCTCSIVDDEAAFVAHFKAALRAPADGDLRMSRFLSVAILARSCCLRWRWRCRCARLLRGPSAQDRVLALDFLYVNGMLVMLVLGDPLRQRRCTSRRRC